MRTTQVTVALFCLLASTPAAASPVWYFDQQFPSYTPIHTSKQFTSPPNMRAVACDIDDDGSPEDLYWWASNSNPRIWHGEEDQTFTDEMLPNFVTGTISAALAGDFDGSGQCDLLLYRQFGLDEVMFWRHGDESTIELMQAPDGRKPFVYEEFFGDHIFWYVAGDVVDEIWHPIGSYTHGYYGTDFDIEYYNVIGTYEPFVGDFDGDWNQDIFWFAAGANQDWIWWQENGGGYVSDFASMGLSVVNTYRPVTGEFGFDFWDEEILWYAPSSAQDFMWTFADRTHWTSSNATAGGNYHPVSADFDGDGDDDVYWAP